MKKQKQRNSTRTPSTTNVSPPDGPPLFGALREAFEWALDVATRLARDFPEDVEAVARVRTFERARIAGQPSQVPVDDVLFTFALIIGAIERDLGPVASLGPWFAPAMWFPSASELRHRWEPKVPAHLQWALGITPTHRVYA